jgi:hypothetical protein
MKSTSEAIYFIKDLKDQFFRQPAYREVGCMGDGRCASAASRT